MKIYLDSALREESNHIRNDDFRDGFDVGLRDGLFRWCLGRWG